MVHTNASDKKLDAVISQNNKSIELFSRRKKQSKTLLHYEIEGTSRDS